MNSYSPDPGKGVYAEAGSTEREASRPLEALARAEACREMDLPGIVLRITADFCKGPAEGVDEKIRRALESIAGFAEVDRAYVFLCEGGRLADKTHEWCAPGTEATRISRPCARSSRADRITGSGCGTPAPRPRQKARSPSPG